MYIRLVQFNLGPRNEAAAKELADTCLPKIRAQKGCQSVVMIMDDEAGDYGLVIHWHTEADANAAAQVIGPQLMPAIAKIATAEASVRLYEVYPAGE